jgi:hypothetical protein
MIFHASKRDAEPGVCAAAAIASATGTIANQPCNFKRGLTFAIIFSFLSVNSPEL